MFRSFAIFLVAALASPLCCCLGAGLEAAGVEGDQRVNSHACCASASEDPVSAEKEICPHQLAKNSQILESTHLGDLAKLALCPNDGTPWSIAMGSLSGSISSDVEAPNVEGAAPVALALGAQSRAVAYCRFLI